MIEENRDKLRELLAETGRAHHQAFSSTGGEDEDWPIWYAEHLVEPLRRDLGISLSRSQLIYCLMDADFEHKAVAPDSPWVEFYADHLQEHYAPSESGGRDKLALYHFASCPFCALAREPIERLGVEVELRDIYGDNPQHLDELVAARGRATVPVLRITTPDGEDHWMPESRDIVRYIESTYG
jgi:glutaredoxin